MPSWWIFRQCSYSSYHKDEQLSILISERPARRGYRSYSDRLFPNVYCACVIKSLAG